jgi:hypothetical protein
MKNIDWEDVAFVYMCVIGLAILTAFAVVVCVIAYVGVRKLL